MSEVVERKVRVSPKEFIKAWEAAQSVKEVSVALGITPAAVANRANKYRDPEGLNIPLKDMPRAKRAKIDTDSALQMLAEIRGVSVESLRTQNAVNT